MYDDHPRMTRSMSRGWRTGAVVMAFAFFAGGCYGPFNLTRRLYQWNGQVGRDKWEREFLFVVLVWAPVYSIATLADAVVFNSMEFWTGKNPVDRPSARQYDFSSTKRLARKDSEVLLTYASTPAGAQLLIEQFRNGQTAGSLRVEQRHGMTVGLDEEGQVLFTASSGPAGGIVIHNGAGEPVASYSAEDVERFVESARH